MLHRGGRSCDSRVGLHKYLYLCWRYKSLTHRTRIAFWRRYRIQLHVSEKALSTCGQNLESVEAAHSFLQGPPTIPHTRTGSVQRWPAFAEQRPQSMPIQRPIDSIAHPFTSDAGVAIPEEALTCSRTPATISHMSPVTDSRDVQGFPKQKP